jgi:hypothetical protein
MVVDLRKVGKSDLLGRLSIVHSSIYDKGGMRIANLFRRARKVETDQVNGVGLGINYAGEVGGIQVNGVGLGVNYAGEFGGSQKGGILCIQTEKRKADQRFCLIRYNRLEGWGIGSSVWAKIERAEKYLDSLKEREADQNYREILESFADNGVSLIKKITGHNTRKDVLARQARKRLSGLEKELSE